MEGGEWGALGLITAAVTPVVMLSAAALLIMGVNHKYALLAGRIRALSAEFRLDGLSAARRENVRGQLEVFALRFRLVTLAHQALYTAVILLAATVFTIGLSRLLAGWEPVALGLFLAGVAVTVAGVAAELLEVRLARRTLALELADVALGPEQAGAPGRRHGANASAHRGRS